MMVSYAYIHAKPDTTDIHGIFYVGKGTRSRAMKVSNCRRNKRYTETAASIGVHNVLKGVIECSSAENALLLEKGLIKLLRNNGVMLTNITSGGGPQCCGRKLSQEEKDHLSRMLKGKKRSDETKKKISEVSKRTTERFWSNPENRVKASERMKNRFKNQTTRDAASKRLKDMWSDPIKRQKMMDARKAKQ